VLTGASSTMIPAIQFFVGKLLFHGIGPSVGIFTDIYLISMCGMSVCM